MHIAAAVGTPVVALYGSQNAVLFQPAGQGHLLLQAALPCTECVAPAHCVPQDSYRNFCVRRLSVDEVFAAVALPVRARGRPAGMSAPLVTFGLPAYNRPQLLAAGPGRDRRPDRAG